MIMLTFDEVLANIEERILRLESERDELITSHITKRQHIDPDRIDYKPLIHLLDKLRAEHALRDGITVAIRRHEEQQARYTREAAAAAPQHERAERERRYRSIVERTYGTHPSAAQLALLRECAEQSEFYEYGRRARQQLRDIAADQASEQQIVERFREQQKANQP